MTTLLLAAILLGAAIVFWRPPRRARRLGLDHLVSTGHAFLVMGVLVGLAIGPRTLPIGEGIGPLVAFIAGWVGFAAGIRFDRRPLRGVPSQAFGMALAPAATAALAVSGLGAGILLLWKAPLEEAIAGGLVLGAAAASSGPTLAATLRARRAGRSARARAALRMIEFSSIVDDVLVIVIAVVAFGLFRPTAEPLASAWFVAFGVLGGVILGVAIWLFLGGRAREDERMLLGLAMLAFLSGFASWLLLSPAAVGAIAGITLVNLPGDRGEQLARAVHRVERTAVVILMALIGIHAAGIGEWIVVALVGVMTAVRFGAKQLGGALVAQPIKGAPGLSASRRWAYGLAPQGTLGLVVAVSFFHVWRTQASLGVLVAVAAASVINELLSPLLLFALVRRVTEPELPVKEPA